MWILGGFIPEILGLGGETINGVLNEKVFNKFYNSYFDC